MAAAAMLVCGHKRSFFEESESPYPFPKKLRHCSSSSSPLITPTPPAVDHQHIDQTSPADDASSTSNPAPDNHASLVESFVKEMACATSLDDARSRASRALQAFNQSITEKVSADLGMENAALKEKIEGMNSILKRAVVIYDERQKEFEDTKRELQNTKEQLRKLEVNNYALSMHLKQALGNTSIPGQFHPHVY